MNNSNKHALATSSSLTTFR